MQFLFAKNTKKQYMAKRRVEPLAGVAPHQFFSLEDFINEKFINPKLQKYSKYEKRAGYAEKKKIFRAKKSPQTLDVRGDPVKLGVKRKRQSFSFRSRNLKIGKYYLVNPETKSVFRFLVTSTKDMGEFTGVTPEFPAVHVSNRDVATTRATWLHAPKPCESRSKASTTRMWLRASGTTLSPRGM